MADNTKYMARIPIVPDDFNNKEEYDHKLHELVMDFTDHDMYVKEKDGYVNITGLIRESIKEIQDSSLVVHLVTEDTLPPIKDRPENHWYYIIESSQTLRNTDVDLNTYIYYGLINNYEKDKNYLLIAQNMITGTEVVKIKVTSGYTPCFYVPISKAAIFKNASTSETIDATIEDRVYALITGTESYVAYDVYVLDLTEAGDYLISVNVTGSDYLTVSFDSIYAISGLVLPDNVSILNGSAIGDSLPGEPFKTDPRYLFNGYSISDITFIEATSDYKPETDMTLYAWWAYADPTNPDYYNYLGYHATYKSSTGKVLGEYYSCNKSGVSIIPKTFTGYTAPGGVALTTDNQEIVFTYEPVVYNIAYILHSGEFKDEDKSKVKDKFTIEDSYTPPTPVKENNEFAGWKPESIEVGSVGDVIFEASWTADAITITGQELATIFTAMGDTDTILGIERATEFPKSALITTYNISSTATPIYAWSTGSLIRVFCTSDTIIANKNMSGAFNGFSVLTDISELANWKTSDNVDMSMMFKDCASLADVSALENWGNGVHEYSSYEETFLGTMALTSGRVPSWYRWKITVDYVSTTGVKLDSVETSVIPNSTIYYKNIAGYEITNPSMVINSPYLSKYEFIYKPLSYTITYELNGGMFDEGVTPKSSYTIEDNNYTPPSPVKKDYTFVSWEPASITKGTYGNVVFYARFTAK